ncbi:MAG: MFS transporter [Oligoflexia bacterium]|nr:MFS transporter [Oligoflexia bacterium]
MNKVKFSKNFYLYQIGLGLSLIGDNCSALALSWWVLEKTGSTVAMSMILAASMITRIVLVPLLGPVADSFKRKNIMLISQIYMAIYFIHSLLSNL